MIQKILKEHDTIFALSTPPGHGGVSVLRVSGSSAATITRKVARFLPESAESHRLYFGTLRSVDSQAEMDEVLVAYFAHGKSYTGEETCEISCHGSPQVVELISKELVKAGARPAGRGEFTYRAFMNGKLDLIQAESVLTLIESQSQEEAKQSLRQLKGHLSEELIRIEDTIIWSLAHLEASIDFSTEDIEVVDHAELRHRLSLSLQSVNRMLESYKEGRILRDGFYVVLCGLPNAGKSSLMNLLCEEERAIVTEIPGTTRDVVESRVMVDGVRVLLMDTAGLRETEDIVEKIGVQKSRQSIQEADLILYVLAADQAVLGLEKAMDPADFEKFQMEPRCQFVLNKKDLVSTEIISNQLPASIKPAAIVSSFDYKSRDVLIQVIRQAMGQKKWADQSVILQARHFESLGLVQQALEKVLQLEQINMGAEILSLELKHALVAVQEILGKRYDDQIIDRIFKEFCLGK
jgi:tRNA modification GTPase